MYAKQFLCKISVHSITLKTFLSCSNISRDSTIIRENKNISRTQFVKKIFLNVKEMFAKKVSLHFFHFNIGKGASQSSLFLFQYAFIHKRLHCTAKHKSILQKHCVFKPLCSVQRAFEIQRTLQLLILDRF